MRECDLELPDYHLPYQQAFDEGLLMDLTSWAMELGFRLPIACSSEVWEHLLLISKTDGQPRGDRNRIRMVLKVLRKRMRDVTSPADHIAFCYRPLGPSDRSPRIRLIAVWGSGENGETVITIVLRNQIDGGADAS